MGDEAKPPMKETPTLEMKKVVMPETQLDELVRLSKAALEASQSVKEQVSGIETTLVNVVDNTSRVVQDVEVLKTFASDMTLWKGVVDKHLGLVTVSVPVRLDAVSQESARNTKANEEQAAAIASIIVKVDEGASKQDAMAAEIATVKKELAAVAASTDVQTAILKRLDSAAANPMVRRIAYALGSLILLAIGAATAKLSLQPPPAPVIVAPAATVHP